MAEPWGFAGPDHVMLGNQTGHDLNNCTVLVSLRGKNGEVRQNVHFMKRWPNEKSLEAFYASGSKVLNQTLGRTTVTLIQDVRVEVYCDELSLAPITYRYAGENRDAIIGYYLDKKFTATAAYRPFSKGLIVDDERRITLGFRGLDFLPPGRLTLILKNGSEKVTRTSSFPLWRAGEDESFEFKDINWDPAEWSVRFQFDDTDVTRTYTWTGKRT